MATAQNPNDGMVLFNGRRYTELDAKAAGIKVDKDTKKAQKEAAAAEAAALVAAAAVGNTPDATPEELAEAEKAKAAADAKAEADAKAAADAQAAEDAKAKQVAAPPENKAVAAPKASTRRRS